MPNVSEMPIPLEYIDILRATKTNLDDESEARIDDYWYDQADANRDLSGMWTGHTVFQLLRPRPPSGHEWVEGRLTRIQETTRPGNVWVEHWTMMSKKKKKEARRAWPAEKKR